MASETRLHTGFFLLGEGGRGFGEGGGEDLTDDLLCIATYMCIYALLPCVY